MAREVWLAACLPVGRDDYFAVSVGESQFDAVNRYISNQEEHHQRKTFQQEYDEFIKNYQFVIKGLKPSRLYFNSIRSLP